MKNTFLVVIGEHKIMQCFHRELLHNELVYLELFACSHHGTVVHLPTEPYSHLFLFQYPKA